MMLSGCRHHIPALLTLMVGLEVLGAVPPWTGAGITLEALVSSAA